ncbi:UDP-N-acetylglucosamine 2-epimerase (non-hydrolyzing) [Candidatus Dependentiae bacterium]|nr:UDP-N-acetylglucosamine 2-epimerase (non-hydrolyzing) [Candidatus Dependentiae bacterium]
MKVNIKSPILVVIGTRAEAIKLIPLYIALKKENIECLLCATFQHSDLLQQVFDIFNVNPDFNLNVMIKNQDLFYLQNTILERLKNVYEKVKPKLVLVHGDTTTTMSAALGAFYLHIPVGHVEAGLRTGNIRSPFPEEMNRKLVGQIADFHFAPTAFSTANLLAEGVSREKVFCTGNTVVDSLFWMRNRINSGKIEIDKDLKYKVLQSKKQNKKLILLTAHRRESFDGGLLRIFRSVKKFADKYDDVLIFYPMHPNPNVLKAVKESKILESKNIFATKSLLYKDLIYLLLNVDYVATDSGGIQEEAVSLGRHVLVLRDITERWEGVWDGSEQLVGTNENLILSSLEKCYHFPYLQKKESFVYGDGNSCKRIVSIIKTKFDLKTNNNLENFEIKNINI